MSSAVDDSRPAEEKGRESASPLSYLAGALIFILVYILSIGPAAWVMERTGTPTNGPVQRAAEIFYAPLIWLHAHTFLEEPLEWYVNLFV